MAKEVNLYDQIAGDIKAGKILPVYVLMGKEQYYIDQLLELLTKMVLREEERDFCLNVFYGGETTANAVINAARSFPMGDRLLVILKDAQKLKDIDELHFYLKNPQPSTVLVLVHKEGNFDRRKKFMAEAARIGVVYESPETKDFHLSPIISNYFRQQGLSIDNKSVSLIADSVGPDLTRLFGEMKKLIDAVGGSTRNITPELVEQHIGISKDFNFFEFQNALIARNSFKAFQIAKYFDENPKQNPIQIVLPQLFKMFSQLMVAYYAPSKDKMSLAKYLSLQPWQVERNIMPAMRNYSASKTLSILLAIRDADEKSKGLGGSKISNGDLLKQLIFFILN